MQLAPEDLPSGQARHVAVLVDGENMLAGTAETALRVARHLGRVTVRRVYRDAAQARGWETEANFRTVHTGDARGKNAADMALAIDAVELALRGMADAFVLVTSDGDFTGLAFWLREQGFPVTGVGEAKAPQRFRAACTAFREAPVAAPACPAAAASRATASSASKLLLARVDTILGNIGGDGWLELASLGPRLHRQTGRRIGETGHRTLRSLLSSSESYVLEARGPKARVRLRQRAP